MTVLFLEEIPSLLCLRDELGSKRKRSQDGHPSSASYYLWPWEAMACDLHPSASQLDHQQHSRPGALRDNPSGPPHSLMPLTSQRLRRRLAMVREPRLPLVVFGVEREGGLDGLSELLQLSRLVRWDILCLLKVLEQGNLMSCSEEKTT